MKLKDRTAVVTGATSGFGEAIALLFAAEGASIVAHGRNAERGAELVERLEALGVGAHFVQGDVGEPADARVLAETARREFGQLDALVLNAGVADLALGPFWDVAVEDFDALWKTNVRGMWLCARECAPLVRDGGAIVAMGSTNGAVVYEGFAGYAATKGAVHQLARGMAADLAARRVRVNVVAPGNCETPMNTPFLEGPEGAELRAEIEGTIPLGRMGLADEIARATLYFASDDSSYCTGSTLIVDGGFTML
jgi:NAD(P)-dependent dehydrogenase (short-subunit alcohol dehydrogenase family)